MRRTGLNLFLALVLASRFTLAAGIVRVDPDKNEIVLSHDENHRWEMHDRMCFMRGEVRLVCGEVISANLDDAKARLQKFTPRLEKKEEKDTASEKFVELIFHVSDLKSTDEVVYVPPDNMAPDETTTQELLDGLINLRRGPASLEGRYLGKEDLISTVKLKNKGDDRALNHHMMSDLSIGVNYLFPTLHYQQAINDWLAPGIMPVLFNLPLGNGVLNGYGGFITLNRYGIEPFNGDWIQLGVGFYNMSTNASGVTEQFFTPALMANVGWRWFWASGLNFGVNAGIQYLVSPRPAGSSLDFSGLLPNIGMDLGFAF